MIVILRTSATRQPTRLTVGVRVTYSPVCFDDLDQEERRILWLQVIVAGWSLGVDVAVGRNP